jgi:arylsulfatase A-like enzyme
MSQKKPNILIIWGDDIGITNLSCYSDGLMVIAPPILIGLPMKAFALLMPTGSRAAPPAGRHSLQGKTHTEPV